MIDETEWREIGQVVASANAYIDAETKRRFPHAAPGSSAHRFARGKVAEEVVRRVRAEFPEAAEAADRG